MSDIRNSEGYLDPTPFLAIKNIERERKNERMSNFDIRRGDIFYIYKYPEQVGCEQNAGRPAIIVSNDKCNKNSEVVEIVFCTTQPKSDLPTHVRILSTRRESIALCEQIDSVDKSRIGDFIGTCNEQEMNAIDVALMISLGIEFGEVGGGAYEAETFQQESSSDKKEVIRIEAERDTYKKMYEDLLMKFIGK